MTTVSTAIGVVILSIVATVVIWRVKPEENGCPTMEPNHTITSLATKTVNHSGWKYCLDDQVCCLPELIIIQILIFHYMDSDILQEQYRRKGHNNAYQREDA